MKKKLVILVGCVILGVASHALADSKIIACPALSINDYGKTTYYDPRSGRIWNLDWSQQQKPVWKNASIPQTTMCGVGKSKQGIQVNYQCAVFKCNSDAVTATLGRTQALKCFSTYVSTQNTFYCDSFSMS